MSLSRTLHLVESNDISCIDGIEKPSPMDTSSGGSVDVCTILAIVMLSVVLFHATSENPAVARDYARSLRALAKKTLAEATKRCGWHSHIHSRRQVHNVVEPSDAESNGLSRLTDLADVCIVTANVTTPGAEPFAPRASGFPRHQQDSWKHPQFDPRTTVDKIVSRDWIKIAMGHPTICQCNRSSTADSNFPSAMLEYRPSQLSQDSFAESMARVARDTH
jgi:hypothetical protein